VPVNLLALVRQLIRAFRGLPTELLLDVLVVLLLPPLVLLVSLVPVSLLLLPPLVLLVSLVPVSLLLGFARAGELRAPAVTRIIAVRTTMIASVVVFIYITPR
jgi:hypothetical protein